MIVHKLCCHIYSVVTCSHLLDQSCELHRSMLTAPLPSPSLLSLSPTRRWSTLMKRITEPSFIVDDLMPGIEYLFRVMASNQIGLSKPSTESDQTKMARTSMESDFLQEPFENRYQLMEEISRCVLLEEGGGSVHVVTGGSCVGACVSCRVGGVFCLGRRSVFVRGEGVCVCLCCNC